MNRWLKTVLFLIGSALLTRFIPFSSWFRNVDTLVHELGHALVTLVLSGRVMKIELNPDHSGVTYSLVSPGWNTILVSLAGYICAALFALLLFYLHTRRQQSSGLILMASLALVTLILFVHTGYGVWWLILFLIVTAVMYILGPAVRKGYFLLLAFLCLEESVLGPLTLVLTALQRPEAAGDAANLAHMTPVPAVFWALLFLIVAFGCACASLSLFAGRRSAGADQGKTIIR